MLINQARPSSEMVVAILQKVQLLKEQSLVALFSIKDDDSMSEHGHEFFKIRKE